MMASLRRWPRPARPALTDPAARPPTTPTVPAQLRRAGPGAPRVGLRLRASAGIAGPGAPRVGLRLRASAGIAGPAAFTAAWVTSSLLQARYSVTDVQISGLAAPDARFPWIMITGFVALGGCSAAFGSALQEVLGGTGRAGPAPRLIQAAGVLTVAAGLLRRDQMLLTGSAGESWHNRAHDVISIPVYLALVAIPLLLAHRMRADLRFRALRIPLAVSAIVSAAVLAVFASSAIPSWDAVLQRVAVTIPLAASAAVALRLVTLRSRISVLGALPADAYSQSPEPR